MRGFYPRDRNGRVLQLGDYILIYHNSVINGTEHFVGIIQDIKKESWYRFTVGVKFEGESPLIEYYSERCEWITKRQRIREQKLLMMKLEQA